MPYAVPKPFYGEAVFEIFPIGVFKENFDLFSPEIS